MKKNRNKRVAFAESTKEFIRYMRTYCEMTFGWQHPLSSQSMLWWNEQYNVLEYKLNSKTPKEKQKPMYELVPILLIKKLGSQWHDTQEWTGPFQDQIAKVVMQI